jgi:polyphenol oxidase
MPPSSPRARRTSRAAKQPPAAVEPGQIPSDLKGIDALFASAGLQRSRRGQSAGVARRARFQDKTPEELRPRIPESRTAANGVEWIPVPGWDRHRWLWAGFSTRRGGVSTCYAPDGAPGELNLGLTAEDERENVLRNRRLLAEAVSGDADTPLMMVRQIHSSLLVSVLAVPGNDAAGRPCKGDGLMTDRPGILLGVQTADCTPVLIADRKTRAVAAFHAGWRGTVKRIVENGIGRMRLEFGSRPEDLVAAIGPGIGPCCYQVGEELLSEFESQFAYGRELFHEVYDSDPVRTRYPMLFLTQRAPGHSPIGPSLHLDVAEANRRQLLDAGLRPTSIRVIGGCTSCHRELFFSHRSSRGRAGRMLSVIGRAK